MFGWGARSARPMSQVQTPDPAHSAVRSHSAAPSGHGASGMTLLEVLVVVSITALIVAMLGTAVGFELDTARRHTQLSSEITDFSTTARVLDGLVQQLDPGLTHADPADFSGARHEVAFATSLPQGAATIRSADVRIEVDRAHRLVLRWLARAGDPQRLPRAATLMQNVERLDLAYWGNASLGGAWHSTWTEATPPALIRFRIIPLEPPARPYPDIIVAVERRPWRP